MQNNPFTSETFKQTWLKHFNTSRPRPTFSFFSDLLLVKHKFLPIYFNVGKTHSKGISYTENLVGFNNLQNKIVLVYDVPDYFNIYVNDANNRIKCSKIKQYPGFLVNLEPFSDLDQFMVENFKKSSRYKLKKYKKKLETCFDIKYRMFHGEMAKDEYDFIFAQFKLLLRKRFGEKGVSNNNLDPAEWNFYMEVAYPLILQKKAGLFVIYHNETPIGITLCYFSDEIVFDAITVFDIDYSKFHLGSVTIMKLIEWCLDHKMNVFDFSKGYFDYKKRWATKTYDFEYHLIYDSRSVRVRLLAYIIKKHFEFKQILRNKGVNEQLHKLTFKLKNLARVKNRRINYDFLPLEKTYASERLIEINRNTIQNPALKIMAHDFLYLNNESFDSLKIQKVIDENAVYLLQGKSKSTLVRINP